ncbi:MAG: hypothetical protein HWN68_20110 [Desulfobacterales bacterium]|nr:hypothetical protein [Desulfobacterales bacterium]
MSTKAFSDHQQRKLYELFEETWRREITFGVFLAVLKKTFKLKGDYEIIDINRKFQRLMKLKEG